MSTRIINSQAVIADAYAPSLNSAFAEIASAFGFWPVVLAPYGGERTAAQQKIINPTQTTSDHLKGRAVDIDNHRRFRNINGALFVSILAKHGWRNVQVNGRAFPAEPWHFANQSARPANGGAAPPPTTAAAQVAESEDRTMTDLIYWVNAASKDGKIPANALYYQECPGAPVYALSGGKAFNAGGNAAIYEYQAFAAKFVGVPDTANFGQFSAARYPISGDGIQLLIALRGATTKPTGNF